MVGKEEKQHSLPQMFCVSVFAVLFKAIISILHPFSCPECDPMACPPVSALSCREDQFLVEVRGEKPCCYSFMCGMYVALHEPRFQVGC